MSEVITKVEHLKFHVELPAATSNNGTWKLEDGQELNSSALRERRITELLEGFRGIASSLADVTRPYCRLEVTVHGVAVTSVETDNLKL
jgi:hypothetical protein